MTDTTTSTDEPRSMLQKAAGYLPSLIVLGAIAAVGYWGHATGWKAPSFSQVAGTGADASEEDWCTEHNVPDSRCIKCHPELVGANINDWCPEHGVPESRCTICHPELLTTGVAGDWCPEHGVPETSCTICHPEIAIKGEAPTSETGATVTLADDTGAPPTPTTGLGGNAAAASAPTTSVAPVKDPRTCQTHAMRVQFASGEAVRKAGVKLGQVVERSISTTLSANAELEYDRSRLAQISSPLAGRVWRVEKEAGDTVRQGEVIALIDALEVGRAKAEYLQAVAEKDLRLKTLERVQTSAQSGFRTAGEVQEAEAAANDAEIRVFNARQALVNLGLAGEAGTEISRDQRAIQFLGLPPSLAQTLDPNTTTANLMPVIAPFDGTVIERNVVAGELIEPARPLLVIADTTRMWVTADIPLAEASEVALGQPVMFRPDGAPDEPASGEVSWISTAVDNQTRTLKIRANVANPEGNLRAHTFGKALITIRTSPGATAVPSEAIQWEGCCYIAFVRLTEDIFQTRKVKLGAEVNGFREVKVGLVPGEVVATEGSYVLKSEILKSALGAGCTDH